MSDAALNPTLEALHAAAPVAQTSIAQIFLEFLLIGATSFGGVVPYLRGSLVTKRHGSMTRNSSRCFPSTESIPCKSSGKTSCAG
jgi:chromate transporter